MALISSFFRMTANLRPHATTVECGYQVLDTPSGRIVQLSTFGSDARQSDKKMSQTIQLDAVRARELVRILEESFPT